MITDTLADELDSDADLDASNDLEYLLGLAGEAAEHDGFADDTERAEWAVAHWCQEVGYLPDLGAYEAGQIVPKDSVPANNELELYRIDGDIQ